MVRWQTTVCTFNKREIYKIKVPKTAESIVGGHDGGDYGIIEAMDDYFIGNDHGFCAADIDISVKNLDSDTKNV